MRGGKAYTQNFEGEKVWKKHHLENTGDVEKNAALRNCLWNG
jgi:hypothetical protein